MEHFLTDVKIQYKCPKCNAPVSVFWLASRFPIARMGIAFRKKCTETNCIGINLRVISVAGKVIRSV